MSTSETPIDAVIERVRRVYRGWHRQTPVTQMRGDWDALFATGLGDATTETVDADGVPCRWIAASGVRTDAAILYLHGGGFQVGSTASHAELMAALSRATQCRVLGVDYRLAPENTLDDAIEDVAMAYRWLCRRPCASRTVVIGDSAGGNLALTLAIAARDCVDGTMSDAHALVLMSPWVDMTASGESYETRSAADPIHQRAMIQALARKCLGPSYATGDPRASPLFAQLAGLPSMLIQVGDRETLLSDATRLADRARDAGVPVSLQVWDGMIHVFQQFPNELREARDAIDAIGDFVAVQLDHP